MFLGPAILQRCEPAARRRAAFGRGHTPLPIWDRADSGPLAAFSSVRSIGTITRSVPPRSSRRNAPRGPNSARSLRLRFAPAPRGLVQSFSIRGRRGGCAAHGAAVTGLCYGPRYAAIWHAKARQLITSRDPRDEALRNSGAPTVGSRQRVQAGGRQMQNSKSVREGGRAPALTWLGAFFGAGRGPWCASSWCSQPRAAIGSGS